MKLWQAAVIVFFGGCCYGVLSTIVKLAYAAGYIMQQVSAIQFLCGASILWILFLFSKKKRLTGKETVKMVIAGLPMGLTGIMYYQTLNYVDASLAIIFLFQFVWIGTFIEFVFFRKIPSKAKLTSIFLLLSGSLLATGVFSNGFESIAWQGVVWGLLSACSFSTFLFVSSAVGKDVPAIQKSALLSTGGLILVLILFPPTFLLKSSVALDIVPYGLFLGFFGVVLPPLLFSTGMPIVGVGLGTILAASELPVAVTASALILGEYVGPIQWLGVAIILGGIFVGNMIPEGKPRYRNQKQRQVA